MRLQQYLFEKKELIFQTAVEEALAAEAAKLYATNVHQSKSPPMSRKSVMVHQELVSESADEDNEILLLWSA